MLAVNWLNVESKTVKGKVPPVDNEVAVRDKRAIDVLSLMGLVVSVGAHPRQGAVCTSAGDICAEDKVTPKLEKLEKKLEDIRSDFISIRKDVEDIWDTSKRKWYFDHIKYIRDHRKKVIGDLTKVIREEEKKRKEKKRKGKEEEEEEEEDIALAKDRQRRFIREVLGGTRKDEYVQKALFFIPDLVTKEGLVTHYLNSQIRKGKSKMEAARMTWTFIRRLFR